MSRAMVGRVFLRRHTAWLAVSPRLGLAGALVPYGMVPALADEIQVEVDTSESEGLSARLEEVRASRERLFAAAEEASERLNGATAKLNALKTSRDAVSARLAEAEEALDKARSDLADEVRRSYRSGNASAEAVLLAPDVDSAVLADHMATREQERLASLVREAESARDELKAASDELESRRVSLVGAERDARQARSALERSVRELEDYETSLDESLSAALAREEEERQEKVAEKARQAVRDALDARDDAALERAVRDMRDSGADLAVSGTVAEIVVASAYSQLDVPYVWGGDVPGEGLDCSGLVQYCYRQAGIELDHWSESQKQYCNKPASAAVAGDIVYTPGHVGICIGDGRTIEAVWAGVSFGTVDSFMSSGSPVS